MTFLRLFLACPSTRSWYHHFWHHHLKHVLLHLALLAFRAAFVECSFAGSHTRLVLDPGSLANLPEHLLECFIVTTLKHGDELVKVIETTPAKELPHQIIHEIIGLLHVFIIAFNAAIFVVVRPFLLVGKDGVGA